MKFAIWLATVVMAAHVALPGHQSDAKALRKQIDSLANESRYKEAAELAERLVAMEAKAAGKGSLRHCRAKIVWADMLMSDAPDRSRKVCEETALELQTIKGYADLAQLYYTRGSIEYPNNRMEEAKYYRLGLEALAKVKSPDKGLRGSLLSDLGFNLHSSGDFSLALSTIEQALQDFRSLGSGQQESIAVALNNKGLALHELGALQESIGAFEEAIRLEAEASVEESSCAVTFLNFGSVLRAVGRIPEARTFLLRAEKSLRVPFDQGERFDYDSGKQIAELFTELGLLYSTLGDPYKSKDNLQLALQTWQRTEGSTGFDVARARNNLATELRKNGKPEEAVTLFLEAIPAYRKQFQGPSALEAGVYNNLGLAYEDAQNPAKAAESYEMAMKVHCECLPKAHQDYGIYSRNFGLMLFRQGHNEEAELTITSCIANWRKSLGPNHPSLVDALHSRAVVRAALKKEELANLDLAEASRLASNAVWAVAKTGGESDALSYSSTFGALISTVAEQTNSGKMKAEVGYGMLLQLRGTALRALFAAQQSQRIQRTNPVVAKVVDKVRAARIEVSMSSPDKMKVALDRLALAEADLNALMHLGRVDQSVTPAMVCQKLPADGQLLEFVRFGKAPQYGVFRVSQQGVEWHRLGEAAAIDRFVALSRTFSGSGSDGNVFSSIFGSSKVPTQLFIVPDGSLHSYPFAAMKSPSGKFLIEHTTMHWLSSGRDLTRKEPEVRSNTPVIVANPDFGRATGVQSLPGTAREARQIQPLLRGRLYTQSKASEETLQSFRSPRVLHIASHGSFADESIGTGGRAVNPMMLSANPLMRSCLLLAGANEYEARRKKKLADGWLTAWEVASMELDGTRLVVLSACKTGVGDLYQTEGVVGLRSAFRAAGADAVVMSLDRVSDDASAELMSQFYRTYSKSKSPAKALREAQLALIRQKRFSNPENWSLFIVEGAR